MVHYGHRQIVTSIIYNSPYSSLHSPNAAPFSSPSSINLCMAAIILNCLGDGGLTPRWARSK